MSRKSENFGASPEAIRYHYDIGNDFYKLWLDKELVYSCALWEQNENHDALETAQQRKIDYHLKQVRAENADRVLDIGCGWGAVLKRLVETYECSQAVGLTLSSAQADWISSFKIPQIKVEVASWAEHCPQYPYDAIISIGAFEHFAKGDLTTAEKVAGYRQFFSHCHSWLNAGGCLSLQTIAHGNTNHDESNQFIAEEVFPESELPRLSEIAVAAERLFEFRILRNERRDYRRTLRAWLHRLKSKRDRAVQLEGEATVQRYERYLKQSIFVFDMGICDLYRITFRRIDKPRQ